MTDFKDAADNFYAVAEKYADVGASDTEPRGQFTYLIERVCRGLTVGPISTSPRWWQLFSDMAGADVAAAKLAEAAEIAVEAARKDPEAASRYVGL